MRRKILKEPWSYEEAFSRNAGIISAEDQARIRNAHVAIAGMGGVGGIYATTLARLGIGNFTIADPDQFEIVNTNRQQGAFLSTYGKMKNTVMAHTIQDINPTATVRIFDALTEENIADFLTDVTVVLDGIDFFALPARKILYRSCRSRNIPIVSAGPVGFGASMINFSPQGMSLEEYFAIDDTMTEGEQLLHIALGVTPLLLQRSYFSPKKVNLDAKKSPSSVLGTLACASMVGCELLKVVTGQPYEHAPVSWQYDPYVRKMRRCVLWRGNRNPIQLLKKWYVKKFLGWGTSS